MKNIVLIHLFLLQFVCINYCRGQVSTDSALCKQITQATQPKLSYDKKKTKGGIEIVSPNLRKYPQWDSVLNILKTNDIKFLRDCEGVNSSTINYDITSITDSFFSLKVTYLKECDGPSGMIRHYIVGYNFYKSNNKYYRIELAYNKKETIKLEKSVLEMYEKECKRKIDITLFCNNFYFYKGKCILLDPIKAFPICFKEIPVSYDCLKILN